jgi:hypothetical protein
MSMIGLVSGLSRQCRSWVATSLSLALFSTALAAQDSGRGYFQAGLHWLELDALNDRLTFYGIPSFDDHFLTLGGGGHVEIDRLLLGAEGHGLLGQTESSPGFSHELSGGYGFFNVGGVIIRDNDFRVFGLVGLGGGGFELETTERALLTWDDVMANPRRGAELTVGGVMLQTAFGADYIADVDETFGLAGVSVGVRIGFTYQPETDNWEMEGLDTPGGPEVAITGFYARLSVGGVAGR